MNNSELLTELQRYIDKNDLLIFNEETSEFLTGEDLKLRENGVKVQITLNKKKILTTRNPSLRVIVLNLDDDMVTHEDIRIPVVQRNQARKEARSAAKFLRDQEAVFKPGKGWFLEETYLGKTAIRAKRFLAPGR